MCKSIHLRGKNNFKKAIEMGRCQKFGLGVRCPLQGQEVCTLIHDLCYNACLATQPLFSSPASLEELIG